ncbi:unnamed protein product [Leptosia nina]|uniref:Gustatory receptor n=1 Tax=Leptosia nina TaxID=320188 RepID=A0AAV1IZ30_9NEOP
MVGSERTPNGLPHTTAENAPHCTVSGAHAFILRISSVFGLAPLRFEAKGEGFIVRVSGGMCLYSYLLVTTLVVCTVCGLRAEVAAGVTMSVRMSSRVAQFVSACDVLAVTLTAGAGIYQAPARMRAMISFMETVAAVDESIGAEYSRSRERWLSFALLAILIFFTILVADDFCFYALQARKIDREWDVVTNYVGFYLLWYVVIVLELQFAFTALSVRARFRALNDALAVTARHVSHPENFFPVEKVPERSPLNVFAIRMSTDSPRRQNISLLVDSLPTSVDRQESIIHRENGCMRLAVPAGEAVRRLAALQGALCEVLRRVESGYGVPLALLLLSALMHLIVTPYFFIMEIRLLVIAKDFQGKRTEQLVCRLLRAAPAGSGTLSSRLEMFSRQLLLQSVCYSPMGLCTLGRPLVATVRLFPINARLE